MVSSAQRVVINAHAEVVAAVYASSATLAAFQRDADAKLRTQKAQIDALAAKVKAGDAQRAAELTAAQEAFSTALAAKDRAYSEEIAIFRKAVTDIASTPEGAAALAQFNAGDEVGALAVLDKLSAARDAARKVRADIESAAEKRRIAKLANDARNRGKQTLAQVITRYEEITRLDPGVHWDWVMLARLYQDARHLSQALTAAKHAASTATDDRDRSVALNELGDTIALMGDRNGALVAYSESLKIDRRLASSDPGSALAQYDVSATLARLGEVLVSSGDRPGALAADKESLEILRRLASSDPGNAMAQRDLSSSLGRLGDVLLGSGDRAGALAAYNEVLGTFRRLAASDPGNAEAQQYLSISLDKVGDVLVSSGDRSGALSAYKESLEIRRRLASSDLGNAVAQRDLWSSLYRCADFEGSGVKWAEVLAQFELLKSRGWVGVNDADFEEILKQKVAQEAKR
jgi:tetratricopeptide (TPR) repeat protein